MYAISVIERFSDAPLNMISGITDIAVVRDGGVARLYTATRAGGGVLALQVGDAISRIDLEGLPSGPSLDAPARVDVIETGGAKNLFITGANGSALGGFALDGAGALGPGVVMVGSLSGAISAMAVVQVEGQTLFFTARAGESVIHAARLTGPQAMVAVGSQIVGPNLQGIDITGLLVVQAGGSQFLVALSQIGDAVLVSRIGAGGVLTATASTGAAQGLGLADPADLRAVTVGGNTYVLVASPGSSSISVMAVRADGTLRITDHVIDTLDTRFAGVQTLAVAQTDGRAFVIAGGRDDGVTVFTLLPDGRMLQVAQVLGTEEVPLRNITAIAAEGVGGVIEVYLTTAGEGLTRLRLVPGVLAAPQIGRAVGDTLLGGAGDDLLAGGAGHDSLTGGDGRDILMDGTGRDTLWGGAGADIFVLQADGHDDMIGDYQAGIDRIDLTGWGRIYDVGSLTITSTAGGATIEYGAERLMIGSANGLPIGVQAFVSSDLFGLWHAVPLIIEDGRRILGTAGAEVLLGGLGDDVLVGNGGADTLHGDEGVDLVDYTWATIGFVADLAQPALNAGVAAGNVYSDIEGLIGGAGNDTLFGFAGDDVLRGGGGQDGLSGRDGDDRLDGGDGNDTLAGGAGADRMDGGAGLDAASYADAMAGVLADLLVPMSNTGDAAGDVYVAIEGLTGSGFADTLWGNDVANQIIGDAGGDVIAARGGADVLDGGAGNDSLYGGDGADSLYGGDGNEQIGGGAGADLLDGGGGRDLVFYWDAVAGILVDMMVPPSQTGDALGDVFIGIEDIAGSNFGDMLAGDFGANIIMGLSGNDTLIGRSGADTLFGEDGNDQLGGGPGADRLDGGVGRDMAFYWDAAAAVRVDLMVPQGNTGDALGDFYLGIEDLAGSNFGDMLAGDMAANGLMALAGDDTLVARGGDDTLWGGDGNDQLGGGAGADRLNGGAGRDIVFYWDAPGAVTADLAAPGANRGDAAGDSYVAIEDLFGSGFADTLGGDGQGNSMNGLGGADTMFGRDGADTLFGSDGDDRLQGDGGDDLFLGGAGADQFVFHTGHDRIADFANDVDTVVVHASAWGGGARSVQDILAFAVLTANGVMITLAPGNVIDISGLRDIQQLGDDIILI